MRESGAKCAEKLMLSTIGSVLGSKQAVSLWWSDGGTECCFRLPAQGRLPQEPCLSCHLTGRSQKEGSRQRGPGSREGPELGAGRRSVCLNPKDQRRAQQGLGRNPGRVAGPEHASLLRR